MKDRLFLGIPVTETYAAPLYRYTAEFAQRERLTVVPPQNHHITISYFGEREECEVPNIVQGIERVTETTKPFPLFYRDVISAPPKNPGRMIWARFEDSSEFQDFVKSIEKEVGNQAEADSFRVQSAPLPHITLARGRQIDMDKAGLPFNTRPESLDVSMCVLFTARATQGGPAYRPLEVFSLKK